VPETKIIVLKTPAIPASIKGFMRSINIRVSSSSNSLVAAHQDVFASQDND
jgi:hypothetical protein